MTGISWERATSSLRDADTYWLATVRPDGRPHAVPVVAVWLDEALHFVASPTSRKARNLAADPHLVITTRAPGVDLVVEGTVTKVGDEPTLHRVARAYATKYRWPVEVRDGAFHGEGAPTAGPPPYEIYRVRATTVFGFPTEEATRPATWRFT
jgi:nitroimidazol reductase NimA-like FMN-containing flavoprotein (pyridoxamine 5'-phosphate oxidase superfamily)